jgi:hypothetical protein
MIMNNNWKVRVEHLAKPLTHTKHVKELREAPVRQSKAHSYVLKFGTDLSMGRGIPKANQEETGTLPAVLASR